VHKGRRSVRDQDRHDAGPAWQTVRLMDLRRALLEPPARSPRDRRGRFVNHARTVQVSPTAWHAPRSEEEIVEYVSCAAASGRRIRVVGAGHSWSPIAAPEDLALSLDRLTGLVDRGPGWVRVRAGTRLRDLLAALAREGETLPIIGSITQQSVAGAVATATHGSSLVHGNLSTLVLGARLVTGEAKILDLYDGDERLDGVRVHLGALGVVTELTLRTAPAFSLAETIEQVRVEEVGPRVEELGRSAEFVKAWWMPHTPKVLVFRYDRTGETMTRWPSPETQRAIETWLPKAVLPPLFAWHEGHPATVPLFNRVATRWLMKGRRVGPSPLMLTTPEPVRHHETEAALPLPTGGEGFDRVVQLIDDLNLRINFILELRYARGDSAWMSTAQGGDVVHLGACTAVTGQRHAYFEPFWKEMRRLGGRPHWAKEMDHDASEIRSLYPLAYRFIDLRDQLDPGRVFANRFLDRVLGT
jgi:L-gulono-1,4-lactone dehydrogenase